MKRIFLLLAAVAALMAARAEEVSVLQWNIWQQGTKVPGGGKAIADEIARLKPDFVTLSEVRNYGGVDYTAALVDSLRARGLNYYTFPSYDSGILSAWPPVDTLTTIFPCVDDHGSIYRLVARKGDHEFAIYTAHLDYLDDAYYNVRGYDGSTWKKIPIPTSVDEVLARNVKSQRDDATALFIAAADADRRAGRTVILGGDFNEPSHRDWTEATASMFDHHGLVVPWTVTGMLEDAGMIDTYRDLYPDPVTHPGFTYPSDNPALPPGKITWTPDADERERIDYLCVSPETGARVVSAEVFGPRASIVRCERVAETGLDPFIEPLGVWPTDHKGLLVKLRLPESAKNIFRPDSITISGRIINYEPDSLVNGAFIGAEDILVRRGGKRVIPINADGTFSRTFWLPNAQKVSFKIYPMNSVGVYLEPGETLNIEVDYNALSRNAYRNIKDAVRFGGSLGRVNAELAAAPDFHAILALNSDVDERISPQQFKDSVIRNYDRQNIELERYIATLPADSKTPAILRTSALADAVGALSQYAQGNESHKFLPLEYYRDFVGALLHSDSTILVNQNAQSLLSDLASSQLLPSNRYGIDMAELRQSVDFIKSHGGEFTSEELVSIYSNFDTIAGAPVQCLGFKELVPSNEKLYGAANSNLRTDAGSPVQYLGFKELVAVNEALYGAAKRAGIRDEFSAQRGNSLKIEAHLLAATRDSLEATNPAFLREFFGLEKLPAIWEYAVALRDLDKIMCSDTLDLDSRGITDPTLRARLESQHAAIMSGSRAFEASPAADYFKKLVEPFRGKYLYIDFWEMYCPPCRADIQRSVDFREKYKDSPDFAIMFICSENGTSPDGYEKYSREFMPHNVSLRLSRMQIDMLGELVNCNSVPYGVLVDPQGNILRTDFDFVQFDLFLREKSFIE